MTSPEGKQKRKKAVDTRDSRNKQCIICKQIKYKGSKIRFRIEDKDRAKNFINAYNFNKDIVYTCCVLCKSPKDIFAADIMNNKKCIES